jgi:transcription antitermination factor NusG
MNWYCIRCPSPARAAHNLKERQFETYHPVETRWRHGRVNKVKIDRSLFPGYMFVRCTPNDFYAVTKTEGVGSFVRYPSNGIDLVPMAFPDECIGDLISQQHFGMFDATRSAQKRAKPKPGERAKVVGGKWRGYVAEVLSVSPKTRKAHVLLETIQGDRVRMTLDVAHLDAA